VGTQRSTLIMTMVDNVSHAAEHAEHSLHKLGISTHNITHILEALGVAFSLHEAIHFGKESVELVIENESVMRRLKMTMHATAEETEHLHHAMVEMERKTGAALEDIEKGALRLGQAGVHIHEIPEILYKVARAASAGYGEVDKLSGLTPRLMKQLKIPVEELDLALGALVSASQRLPEGDKSFDVLVGGLQKVSPLLAKLGWTGQAGLVKYLAYINQLTADLGSTDAAAAAFEETIALMQSPRTAARFRAAFGKSFDIVGAVAAATKAGMDPLKAFLEFAEAAAEAGHPVLNTGELQKAMQTYQKGGAAMRAVQRKIKDEAGHIVDDVLTGKLNTAEMAMRRLTAAWKQFSIMFGKMLLSSGTLDYLDKVLLPAIQKVMEATAEVQKLTKKKARGREQGDRCLQPGRRSQARENSPRPARDRSPRAARSLRHSARGNGP
jgi:TP901 family phage tail tape measure protein